MPELPEVENYRKFLEGTALHKKIIKVWVDDGKLTKPNEKTVKNRLKGNRFTGTKRIGKYLFVKLENNEFLIMHFGLTGNLGYYKDEEDKPRFTRVTFHLENGFFLAFICMRKFGWIRYEKDLEKYLSESRLGKDAN